MSARVFIHPSCVPDGLRHDLLNHSLELAGYDLARTVAFTHPSGRYELMVRTARHEDDSCDYMRGDGVEFRHPAAPQAPRAA